MVGARGDGTQGRSPFITVLPSTSSRPGRQELNRWNADSATPSQHQLCARHWKEGKAGDLLDSVTSNHAMLPDKGKKPSVSQARLAQTREMGKAPQSPRF